MAVARFGLFEEARREIQLLCCQKSPKIIQMLPSKPHIYEFLLFDGFSNLVLASAMEPLRDVSVRAYAGALAWRVSSFDGQPVRSSSGLSVAPDGIFDAKVRGRTLVLVAGYHFRTQLGPEQLSLVRTAARNAVQIIAVDTAPWIAAAAGLLDGHQATIHWQEFEAFQETFPNVHATEARFVKSGRFVTCGGASTAFDMVLDLLKERFGSAAAFEASNMFNYDLSGRKALDRGGQTLRGRASEPVMAALDVMAESIEVPLTTFDIADRIGVSERTLNRLFHQELGMPPGKYFRLFRLQAARHLAMETSLSQEQIALRCGFGSGVSLARSFSSAFGVSIREVRVGKS